MNLILLPINTKTYFNIGHRLNAYTSATYLHNRNIDIDIIDCLNTMSWKEFSDLIFSKQYNNIFIWCDYDTVDNLERTLYYIRNLSKNSKVGVFGRLVFEKPNLFYNMNIDYICEKGDPELFMYKILSMHNNNLQYSFLETLVLPNLKLIPYEKYWEQNLRKEDKYCSIANKKELVVPIARGCPINCKYCDVPKFQGKKERRVDVNSVVEYIIHAKQELNFDYISFYAPTFTLNKKWVIDFCSKIVNESIKWKCVTIPNLLDENLVSHMAEAGCFRISIGLETIKKNEFMGKAKQETDIYQIENIFKLFAKYDIELNIFLMLGFPGESEDDIRETYYFIEKNKKKYNTNVFTRETIYTDYSKLNDINESYKFNRQIFSQNSELRSIINQKVFIYDN